MEPTLLLTRPAASAQRVAEAVTARLGPVPVVVSPLMQIVDQTPPGVQEALIHSTVIVTSREGARRALMLGARGVGFAVGEGTAQVLRQGGMTAQVAEDTADSLIALIQRLRPDGPLIHLRGTHARVPVAARLRAAGLPCEEAEVYDQRAQPLSPKARALIDGEAPLVVPLFSPRSAALLWQQAQPRPGMIPVAISAAAAIGAGPGVQIADAPNLPAMITAICHAFSTLRIS